MGGRAGMRTVPLTGNQRGRLARDEWLAGQGLGLPPMLLRYAVRLRGPLRVPALAEALNAVVQRHEALRTGIAAGPGGAVQAVHAAADLPLHQADLAQVPDPAADLARFLTHMAGQPFPLDHPPLMRAGLARLSDTEHVLVLAVEHLICDGWSLFAVLTDLARFYTAATGHGPAPAAPAPSWLEWSLAERAWTDQGGLHEEAEHWREALREDLPVLPPPVQGLPADRKYVPERASAQVDMTAFEGALDETGVSLTAGLLTCFGAALAGPEPVARVWAAVPVLNRSLNGDENLVGWLANQRPVPVGLHPGAQFDEAAGDVQEGLLDAIEYGRAAIDELVGHLAPHRWGRIPPVTAAFTPPYDPDPPAFAGLDGSPEPVTVPQWTMGIGLDCVQASGQSIDLRLLWDSGTFDQTAMSGLLTRLQRTLSAASADPTAAVRD